MRGNMYSTSVSYSQIYASLLPGRQSSSYGSHFLIRLVDGRTAGRPGMNRPACCCWPRPHRNARRRSSFFPLPPLHMEELGYIAGLPEDLCNDLRSVDNLVDQCASFLTVRKNIVYFVHQSAKD